MKGGVNCALPDLLSLYGAIFKAVNAIGTAPVFFTFYVIVFNKMLLRHRKTVGAILAISQTFLRQ